MKKRYFFKSIYAKFTLIFIGIWWFMNSLTYGVVMRIMSDSTLNWLPSPADTALLYVEYRKLRFSTGLAFFVSAIVGTILILIAVRGIVKPIRKISKCA